MNMCELLFYQNKGMDSFLFDTKKRPTQVTVCFIITGCSVIQRTYSKIILYSFYNLDFNYKANHGCLHTQPQKKIHFQIHLWGNLVFRVWNESHNTFPFILPNCIVKYLQIAGSFDIQKTSQASQMYFSEQIAIETTLFTIHISHTTIER